MLLYQEDAELLFPARLIPTLRHLRGVEFQQLIEHIQGCPEDDPSVLGFSLLMIRLSSCITCTADSYRAMNGCTRCAHKVIRSFRGTDADLVAQWQAACQEVLAWQARGCPIPQD